MSSPPPVPRTHDGRACRSSAHRRISSRSVSTLDLLLRAILSLLARAAAHWCPSVFYDAHTVEWACFPKSETSSLRQSRTESRRASACSCLLCPRGLVVRSQAWPRHRDSATRFWSGCWDSATRFWSGRWDCAVAGMVELSELCDAVLVGLSGLHGRASV